MSNMNSLGFIVLIFTVMCSGLGCTASYYDYPDYWKTYSKNGISASWSKKLQMAVEKDMLECNFPNTSNPIMPIDKEVDAHLCMAKKGYDWHYAKKNKICEFWRFQNSRACKNQQRE